jgi:hypothetical protein
MLTDTSVVVELPNKVEGEVSKGRVAVDAPSDATDPSVNGEVGSSTIEAIAETLIERAQVDSVITNPTMAIDSIIEYVNEWRDAMKSDGADGGTAGGGASEVEGGIAGDLSTAASSIFEGVSSLTKNAFAPVLGK